LQTHLRELEADLERYPGHRGETLLEIARARLELGEPDRAVEIWRELIAEGGEDEDYARVELAEHLFDVGQDDDARAELAVLKATHLTSGGGWQLAAELLADRGELAESLDWYTMATDRFTPDELATLSDDAGWVSPPGMLVRRRRSVRRRLGLPPDETDRLVPSDDEISEFFRWPARAHRGAAPEVLMLFWPRGEFDAARERWSDAIDQDVSEAEYYRDLEAKLDGKASEGAHRVSAVACSVDSFADYQGRDGDRPLDSSVARREYLDARYNEGHYVQWPPPRNQPCWCGSGTKYKNCCGAPTH